jgi:hypothetical protein
MTPTAQSDAALIRAQLRRLKAARKFPVNTCGASRHVAMIGEALAKEQPYHMLDEEPQHCALSMLATVAALWEARTKIEKLEARLANVDQMEGA